MVALGSGHMMMLVTFAIFLEDEHDVSTSGLGLVALIIGLAELLGSGGVTLFGDKFGKVTVVKYALLLSLPLSIILPFGSSSIWLALLLISLWFVCTECVIVSMLSTCTELDKRARGAMMGFVYAGWALGRLFGAIFGSRVYENSGIVPVALVMTFTLTVALLVIYKTFKEPMPTTKKI
jgi:predicted MFS family arabinose efflux permease